MNDSSNTEMLDSIANLSPYRKNGGIKARVIWKKAKSYWITERFDGNIFNLDLMDATGEIHATAFKAECEKFFDLIEVGNVYIFSGYDVQMVDDGLNYWPHIHKLEIILTSTTEVKLCENNDDEGIPELKLELLPISQVWNQGINEFVDTIGFCTDVGEMDVADTPKGPKPIREITLAHPMSGDSVTLTLWYDEAKNFDGQVGSLILVRGSRIKEWDNEMKLNAGSVLKINVNTPEVHNPSSAGRIFTLNLGLGNFVSSKSDYFQCKAVEHTKQQFEPFEKVKDESNGEKRLLVNMIIGNWTSNRWVTCFNEAGQLLLRLAARFHPELEVVDTT